MRYIADGSIFILYCCENIISLNFLSVKQNSLLILLYLFVCLVPCCCIASYKLAATNIAKLGHENEGEGRGVWRGFLTVADFTM